MAKCIEREHIIHASARLELFISSAWKVCVFVSIMQPEVLNRNSGFSICVSGPMPIGQWDFGGLKLAVHLGYFGDLMQISFS